MKKIIYAILALLGGTAAMAQNALTVSDIVLPQSGEKSLTVSFQVDAEGIYSSASFSLQLPSELIPVRTAGTTVKCAKGSSLDASHTVMANLHDGVVKVAALSLSSQPLAGTSGDMATIAIRPATTLKAGQSFQCAVKDIILVAADGSRYELPPTTFTVTIGESAYRRVVLDEASTIAPEHAQDVAVCVKRLIRGGEWATLCLPFAMTEAQVRTAFGVDVQLGDFCGYDVDSQEDKIYARFKSVKTIAANHPYIIKVAEDVMDFTADDVNIVPASPQVNLGTEQQPKAFIGNYVAGTSVGKGCLYLNANKFRYSVGSTKIKAFRGYFNFCDLLSDYESNYANARVYILFEDDVTGISSIEGDQSSADDYYNLKGQKVQHPVKGVYIVNGQKIRK